MKEEQSRSSAHINTVFNMLLQQSVKSYPFLALIFFAVYEIYKKIYSFGTVYSGGQTSFFFSVKLPNLFIQK